MWKTSGKKEKGTDGKKRGRFIYIALIVVGLLLVISASIDMVTTQLEYSNARKEYEDMAKLKPVVRTNTPPVQAPAPASQDNTTAPSAPADEQTTPAFEIAEEKGVQDSIEGLLEINPDFIGWISIDGVIEYPVVQGRDNNRYLGVTFSGRRNGSGSIFMDCRNSKGFQDTVCILYGHNMRDGSMFAPLNQYHDKSFLADNKYIKIITREEEILTYRIFDARYTDAWDSVYSLGFKDAKSAAKTFRNAPEDANNFLLLSTCTNSTNNDDRLLVYAELVK